MQIQLRMPRQIKKKQGGVREKKNYNFFSQVFIIRAGIVKRSLLCLFQERAETRGR